MRLTLTLYETTYSVEEKRSDFGGEELKKLFSRLMVAAGYPPSVLEEEE